MIRLLSAQDKEDVRSKIAQQNERPQCNNCGVRYSVFCDKGKETLKNRYCKYYRRTYNVNSRNVAKALRQAGQVLQSRKDWGTKTR